MRQIRLTRDQLREIEALAETAFPTESCGLLAGRPVGPDATVTRIRPSPNIAPGQSVDRFEVDPRVRFELMRELEGTDEVVIGHFHSHPGHDAVPSQHDLDMAFEPDLVWLITAVHPDGSADTTRAYRLDRESRNVQAIAIQTG